MAYLSRINDLNFEKCLVERDTADVRHFLKSHEEVSWQSDTSKFFPYYESINMFEFSMIYFSPVT